MSFLELCNWYENRFPNDFEQLIKIKHYNISELSFLLSKVWCKLEFGEQLLMCAIYYDDFNLANQMLNENSVDRVNPFFGKRFFTQTPSKTCLNNTGSIGSLLDMDEIIDVNNALNLFDSLPINTANIFNSNIKLSKNQRRNTYYKENMPQILCTCQNSKRRTSLSSIRQLKPAFLTETSNSKNQINFFNPYSDMNERLRSRNNSSNIPTYYFDQVVCDFYMQTPFYFAIKFNKLKMCELFIENLKNIYTNFVNKKLTRRQQLQNTLANPYYCHNCYKNLLNHKRTSKMAILMASKIWLNSMLDNSELIKLLVLALSNHNYQIAMLILSNVYNPKQILNFSNISESFIYTEEFCLFLVKNKIVDAKDMLKEATNRHAIGTVNLILTYLEEISLQVNKTSFLFDAYKTIVDNSILTCDLNLFRLILPKLLMEYKHSFDSDVLEDLHLTIENIITQQHHHSSLNKLRSTSFDSNIIDSSLTKDSALTKGFDWDLYFAIPLCVDSKLKSEISKSDLRFQYQNCIPCISHILKSEIFWYLYDGKDYKEKIITSTFVTSNSQNKSFASKRTNVTKSLSYLNRLKLLNFLFNDSPQTQVIINSLKNKESKIELLENELEKLWSELEYSTRKKLSTYEKMFVSDTINEYDEEMNTKSRLKRIHLCGYLVLSDNEPFITKCLLKNFKEDYKLSSGDLISVAKNGTSELTLHNLLNNLEFNSTQEVNLLEPLDDVYGNFLEILFCRLVRCNNYDQEIRLRRLFFEAIILKNAKMTCSTNLLDLFLSNSHQVKQKLFDTYFPCLFYLSNSFDLFKNDLHVKRFQILINWFIKIFMSITEEDIISNQQKIDLILLEFYGNRQRLKEKSSFNFNFEMRLKELARYSFTKVYLNHSNSYNSFLNAISDSLRHYILYMNEIKSLF